MCIQPVYKNLDPGIQYSSSLTPGMTLTQEIIPECAGASQMSIWTNTSAGSDKGAARFVVRDISRGEVLAERSIRSSELPVNGWLSIEFETDWESAGKSYELEIQGQGAIDAQGPQISFTQRPEYKPGKLYLDGTPIDEDLLFRYTCLAGPLTILGRISEATN
jgi:hypothetical protein